MPRKTKEKEELIEEKDIKSTKKNTSVNKTSTNKKTTTVKEKKSSTKKADTKTTKTAKENKTLEKATSKSRKTTSKKTSTSKEKKSSSKIAKKETTTAKVNNKSTNKKNKFLTEYYDLPFNYNKTVVKLLAQTPETLFVYWEISEDDKNNFKQKYGDNFFETTVPILKVHNKTMNYTFEIEINDFANCWYFNVNDSKCEYEIELDRKLYKQNEEPQYIYISNSNNLETPNDHILFEQNLSTVQFKNIKTNKIRNVDISKNIYNIENLYKLLYTKEELKDLENISNPSSGNPTSTFK